MHHCCTVFHNTDAPGQLISLRCEKDAQLPRPTANVIFSPDTVCTKHDKR